MMKTIVPLPEYRNQKNNLEDQRLIDREGQRLQEFLSAQGLWVPKSFIQGIRAHDIIEIYAFPDYKQIYANDEFSNISSYTPEQMRTIPLPQLFWRADEDHIILMERAAAMALNAKETENWDVPKHDLVESLHPRKRTFEMSMGLIAPCFSSQTGLRQAFASTLQVDLIYEWPEAVG